jgi:glucose/arabinose dehydrogenase/mono/diheme cytochrome c family protein
MAARRPIRCRQSFAMNRSCLVLLFCFIGTVLRLPATTPVPDPDNGGLILPAGFRALLVASNYLGDRPNEALRFLTVAPNGDLYGKSRAEGIIAFRDTDGDGRFDQVRRFGTGNGTCVAVHDGWLYYSTSDAVYRYKLVSGVLVPAGKPERIVYGLPDQQEHDAKVFAFDGDGRLYVETGSPSNAYGNPDRAYMPPGTPSADPTEFLKTHGGFWRFDPDKHDQTQADGYHFSTGHRHALALAWQPVARDLFTIMMGRDEIDVTAPEYYDALDNAERVAEEMHRLRDGVNLGWPYTYWDPYKKARMMAPEFGGDNRTRAIVDKYDAPVMTFSAHSAPLQMVFYPGGQFPPRYKHGAFIAFHGSWNRGPLPQTGYNIGFAPFDERGMPVGTFEIFAAAAGPTVMPMGGVAVAPDGSLYVSETRWGHIWRIIYTGENASAPSTISRGLAPAADSVIDAAALALPGREIYAQYCATCHMADGRGAVPMQPALTGSAVVAGDPDRLINVVLRGPAAVLPRDRVKYSNVMPAFNVLSDVQVGDLLTFVRRAFGGPTLPSITPGQVTAVREH